MKIWARLRTFNLKQLINLAYLFGQRPLYITLTLKASRDALRIATQHYGKSHQASNKANAFRHALWVVLIGQAVYRRSGSINKAKAWAKKVTDMHENIAVNKPLERAMDLHNNKMGLLFFEKHASTSAKELVVFLKHQAEQAQQIATVVEVKDHPNHLVYIRE